MVKKTRRPHTRSRTGCSQCVRVSCKCDEIRPSCGRCTRLSFDCNYRPRLIWKSANFDEPREETTVEVSPESHQLRQSSSGSPCQCEHRPTSEELFQLYIDQGYNLLQWSADQVPPGEAESCRANPALWAGVEALMSTSHDCCQISSLSRVGHAISLTSSYIDLPSSLDDPEMCQQIMVVLTQVSLRAGYAWSHMLAQMLSYAEQLLPQVRHLPRDEHPVQTRLLEVLGGLDMDIWILGRRSPSLHIWARYCSGRQGVEEITGLPRPLLDLIAQVSQQGNVMADLEHYLDSLDSSLAQHQMHTWQCFALAALYYQYRHFTPWRDTQSLLDKIAAILCQLHQTMHKSNIRALVWPTYVLGRYSSKPDISGLVNDVLLKASTPDQSKAVLYLDLTPYDLMQQVWKLQATSKEDEIDSILAQQFVDYGLW